MEYKILLALIYFKQKGHDYSISELCEVLGLTNSQLVKLIDCMFEKGYLIVNGCMIEISKAGIAYLVSKSIYENPSIEKYSMENIHPEDALKVDEPYVPKRFLVKLGKR